MSNSRGETVGDMIVRERREAMAKAKARGDTKEYNRIAAEFTPRSLRNESWPPTK